MKHLGRVHATVFALAWLLVFVLGPGSVLPVAAVLVAVELTVWRLDLLQLPRSRRPGRAPARGTAPGEQPTYDALVHAMRMGAHSRREFDFGLRRRLQRVAAARLLDGYGVDLVRDPERAAALLGPQVWALLNPARPVSRQRGSGGVDRRTLAAMVRRLEEL
jgi:hypothetical protein